MMTTAFAIALLATSRDYRAPLRPANLFTDHMVLQRDRPIPVFGFGVPDSIVSVELAGQKAETTVQSDGSWIVKFKAHQAGGSYELKLNGTTVATDVTFGDVWIASGQSNMQMNVGSCRPDQVEAARATGDADLRMFTVPDISLEEPAKDVQGQWQPASAATVDGFSAAGYWFARTLRESLKVPIGVIHTSWGGTPAESWVSREMLNRHPNLKPMLDTYLAGLKNTDATEYQAKLAAFTESRRDIRNEGAENGWQNPEFTDSAWKSVAMPATVEGVEGREVDGAFWFRKTINVQAEAANQAATLELGPIDDADLTYVNGTVVGHIDLDVPNHWIVPRTYALPAGTLHAGQNTIAVRVFDTGGGGGFSYSNIRLNLADGKSISLGGQWKYKAERIAKPEGQAPVAPMGPGNPWAPGSLYNGMIAPLIHYGIKGAIWYQGESNAGRAFQYRELFPTMIEDWRQRWGQGNFPFYFVQLANYMTRYPDPTESSWAELREAQTMTLKLPNTGMATIIDIGEATDIHPKDKKNVGYRLALNALAQTYRQKVVATGPMFRKMSVRENEVTLQFVNGTGLRSADGQPIVGFAIAGSDKKFVWAPARIEGDRIILTAPTGTKPVAVRYGWADNPATNLVNGANLPAVPFRTDAWSGGR
jgi:sialate O-acetylesterase